MTKEQQTTHKLGVVASRGIGGGLVAKCEGDCIWLTALAFDKYDKDQSIRMTTAQLRNFEQFLVSIGWRTD